MIAQNQINKQWLSQRRLMAYVVFGLVALTLTMLMFYRLDGFATLRHDEGSYLHVAKNYALHGIYADSSSEGYRFTGPVVSTGPTVIVPIALLYKLFGVSMPLARVVIVIYGCGMIAALYWLGCVLANARLAVVATGLALLSPGLDFFYYSRHVLGEVPGLFFVLTGLALWLYRDRHSTWSLVGVGVLMGLASITKNQYAVFVLPSLGLAWIVDRVWHRQRNWRYGLIPIVIAGLIYLVWTYYVLFLLGANMRNPQQDLEELRSAGQSGFLVLQAQTIGDNLYRITGDKVYGGLFVAAVLYGFTLSYHRDKDSQKWSTLWIFLVTSAGFYVVSVGWDRFAVPAITFSAFFVAHLLYRLTDGYHIDWNALRQSVLDKRELKQRELVYLIVISFGVVAVALPLFRTVSNTMASGDRVPYQVADYIANNIPQDTLIETWEMELGVISDHTFHYPPQVIESYSNVDFRSGPTGKELYDFRDYVDPGYVIVGPFGKMTGIYTPERLENYQLVQSIGTYDIYKRLGHE
jgi:4-amino-4-deoxy-L-arabinose transferase-like glycosyltransferase